MCSHTQGSTVEVLHEAALSGNSLGNFLTAVGRSTYESSFLFSDSQSCNNTVPLLPVGVNKFKVKVVFILSAQTCQESTNIFQQVSSSAYK